jgi:hypothetical protein
LLPSVSGDFGIKVVRSSLHDLARADAHIIVSANKFVSGGIDFRDVQSRHLAEFSNHINAWASDEALIFQASGGTRPISYCIKVRSEKWPRTRVVAERVGKTLQIMHNAIGMAEIERGAIVAKVATRSKKAPVRRPWSKDDLRLLKGMARKEPLSKIAKALKRTEGATRHKATIAGISLRMTPKKRTPAKKR